jgi:hypothetical protein
MMTTPVANLRRSRETPLVGQSYVPLDELLLDPSKIRVFIVDDIKDTCDSLAKLIGFESNMKVVGSRATGRRHCACEPCFVGLAAAIGDARLVTKRGRRRVPHAGTASIRR